MTKVHEHINLLAGLKASAGLSAGIQWAALRVTAKLRLPQPPVWNFRPQQLAHPLQARLRSSSDLLCFKQIFISQEYSCLRELKEPSLVLDLGANAGFSAAYFLSVFPKARVVAVEPDERNLAICKANLLPYGDRVVLVHGAVWSRPGKLRLLKGAFGDGLEWATQVTDMIGEEETLEDVQAWDIASLIGMSGGDVVDLLKVDIERAELSVFGEFADRWLHRIRNICIELHGWDCEKVFFAALKNFNYELDHSGELTICRNLRRKPIASGISELAKAD